MVKIFKKIKLLENAGYYTFTSFYISILSGIITAILFKIDDPYNSILNMIFNNSSASFFRSLHYWSSQIFLIFSILHIFRHLQINSENKITYYKWIRLIITILLIFYVLFSGFLLRSDLDANSAKEIISTLFNSIPFFGKYLSLFFFQNNNLVFVNHISIPVLFILITSIEHSRIFYPKNKYYLFPLIISIILSFFFIPYLNTGNEIIKGPYYFQGLQELLNYLNYPIIILFLISYFTFLLILLPKFKRNYTKKLIYILFLVYFVLSIIAIFFRGENWNFSAQNFESILKTNFLFFDNYFLENNTSIYILNGKPESCINCHNDVVGLSESHNPKQIGCSSCHLGNNRSTVKEKAHLNMLLVPGNLKGAESTCGNSNCHKNILQRVNHSLMNTMSGVISVDKWVFKENADLNTFFDVANLVSSPADHHLKNLCVSCHLNQNKSKPDTISELSRGGGCIACHLEYSDSAKSELLLLDYLRKDNKTTKFHPDINSKVKDEHCFGCHSRSGRISLNYAGIAETKELNKANNFTLQDGRLVTKIEDDIHHKNGLSCIDCHISYEIMGDGKKYSHKEQAIKISCCDCHPKNTSQILTKPINLVDNETRLIMAINNLPYKYQLLATSKNNEYFYSNVYYDQNLFFVNKKTKKETKLKIQSNECYRIKEHNSLDCKTCHTKWSPNCIGCHTEFDNNSIGWDNIKNTETKGAWIEQDNKFINDYPTLGVSFENNQKKITTFSPGMIMTLNKSINNQKENLFYRLFAPVSPHTISKESRTCESCHINSNAIGYGRGKLNFKNRQFSFKSESKFNLIDNLTEDAWIGFLSNNFKNSSTRINTRPFNLDEQKKILTVGACFSCHKKQNLKLEKAFSDFQNVDKYLSKKCQKPDWNK